MTDLSGIQKTQEAGAKIGPWILRSAVLGGVTLATAAGLAGFYAYDKSDKVIDYSEVYAWGAGAVMLEVLVTGIFVLMARSAYKNLHKVTNDELAKLKT